MSFCLTSSNGRMPLPQPPAARAVSGDKVARSLLHPLRLLLRGQKSRTLPRSNKTIKFLQAIRSALMFWRGRNGHVDKVAGYRPIMGRRHTAIGAVRPVSRASQNGLRARLPRAACSTDRSTGARGQNYRVLPQPGPSLAASMRPHET